MDLIFQLFIENGGVVLSTVIRMPLSAHRKTGMLSNGQESTRAMGYSSEASDLVIQLRRLEEITSIVLVYISFQQVQGFLDL